MSDARLSGAAVTQTINNALQCLRRHFRSSDAGAGWYHYLDDLAPGVTASAVGLFVFRSAGATFERTQQVVDYIADQQVVEGGGDSLGGWPVRTTLGFPIAEATAWVVRSLAKSNGSLRGRQTLDAGLQWLERNQNTDLGWGSYKGQASRVFTSAIALLALHEGGGDRVVIEEGNKWLIEAQSPGQPAWGALPGEQATLLHTSVTLLALLRMQGALTANDISQTCAWIMERLEPYSSFERATIVEEYDIPYPDGGRTVVFQNSLPHFAMPVALTALLAAGADPLQPKIFDAIRHIVDTQQENGIWELPRSPLRPSIWATWPYVAALASFRRAVFPTAESTLTLIFPGCAILQTEDADAKPFTRRILFRNAVADWLNRRKVAIVLALLAFASLVIPTVFLVAERLTLENYLISLVVPVLLLIFQLIWARRSKTAG